MTLPITGAYFDPSDRQRLPEEPTLEDVIRQALRQHDMEFHVCMPAAVVAARSPYRVDVQPLLQARYYAKRTPTTLPLVADVPVSMPTGQAWAVKYPQPVRGDTGWLIFADRSLDAWRAGDGSPTDPKDARTHDITDAVFIPGLLTNSAAEAATVAAVGAPSDVVVRNQAATLRVAATGRFQLTNGSNELVDLAQQLADAAGELASALSQSKATVSGTVNAGGSVSGSAILPDLSANAAALNAIAKKLATLVG